MTTTRTESRNNLRYSLDMDLDHTLDAIQNLRYQVISEVENRMDTDFAAQALQSIVGALAAATAKRDVIDNLLRWIDREHTDAQILSLLDEMEANVTSDRLKDIFGPAYITSHTNTVARARKTIAQFA